MNSLRVDKLFRGTDVELSFQGALKDGSEIPEFVFNSPRTLVWVNLAGLTSMNSIGVRIWIDWVAKIQNPIVFHYVSPAFILPTGLVEGMIPKGSKLESFYVPYVNISTSEIELVLFEYGRHFTEKELSIPAKVSSSINGGELEFQEMANRFFVFLKNFFPGILLP